MNSIDKCPKYTIISTNANVGVNINISNINNTSSINTNSINNNSINNSKCVNTNEIVSALASMAQCNTEWVLCHNIIYIKTSQYVYVF